jgi:hypothetical protein
MGERMKTGLLEQLVKVEPQETTAGGAEPPCGDDLAQAARRHLGLAGPRSIAHAATRADPAPHRARASDEDAPGSR